MPWYTAKKPGRESSAPPTEQHTEHPQEATGMRLLRQRAAELSSPPPTNGRGWISRTGTGRPESAAAARVHRRYHVITMYNRQSPFIRLHVPIREECCEIARVCFAGASAWLLRLSFPPSPHTSSSSSSSLRWRRSKHRNRRANMSVGGGPSSFQDYASPHPFPIHFDYYYLICLSSLFPSC